MSRSSCRNECFFPPKILSYRRSSAHRADIGGQLSAALFSYTAVQSQKAVSAHFTSKQILPFGFAEQLQGTDRNEAARGRKKRSELGWRVSSETDPQRIPLFRSNLPLGFKVCMSHLAKCLMHPLNPGGCNTAWL